MQHLVECGMSASAISPPVTIIDWECQENPGKSLKTRRLSLSRPSHRQNFPAGLARSLKSHFERDFLTKMFCVGIFPVRDFHTRREWRKFLCGRRRFSVFCCWLLVSSSVKFKHAKESLVTFCFRVTIIFLHTQNLWWLLEYKRWKKSEVESEESKSSLKLVANTDDL